MNDIFSEHEELLLRSLDAPVSAQEREKLSALMQSDFTLRRQSDHYSRIREMMLRQQPDTFGPFFAERIMNQLKQRVNEIDYLIFFFFKKYQVLLLGVFVALLITNLLLADQFSLRAIFGLGAPASEDIYSIDAYKSLPQ
ncbi:MAG: hypothetical protein KBF45_15555 [Cyclobacteriaceae bacterium]|jgi:hypothetical protein|nr:hypothetical protein [Cyclobacteriaceae bacterium]